MGGSVVAHAGVAAASAAAAPDNPRLDARLDAVERLTRKVEKLRAQLADTERALAEAAAALEGED